MDPHLGPASFHAFLPSPPLRGSIALIWFARGKADYKLERVLPNGVIELMLNLGPPQRTVDPDDTSRYRRFFRGWVAGLQRSHLTITDEEGTDLVGIRFRPGGARVVLGMPLRAVTDRVEEIDDLGLLGLAELRERLLECQTLVERVACVEEALIPLVAGANPDPRVAVALETLRRGRCTFGLGRLAAHLGVSRKHLAALFSNHVGVSPQKLARILRFDRVVQSLGQATATPPWADVAVTHGYFDQSHLIADYREFAGVTPATWFALRIESGAHINADHLG